MRLPPSVAPVDARFSTSPQPIKTPLPAIRSSPECTFLTPGRRTGAAPTFGSATDSGGKLILTRDGKKRSIQIDSGVVKRSPSAVVHELGPKTGQGVPIVGREIVDLVGDVGQVGRQLFAIPNDRDPRIPVGLDDV